ncbi:trans-aconitate 2-methyltransferase [Microlunatus parietis]|uniref:Trans-aconitate 2-methyltransferase n=1 Tax=Microlunatus parietis TaxID=682979 RepID=A0A7Y9IDW9_9ACTN|nr:trans-aconitate 2-methyltransferase [Microlunatus parietis]NYE75161.1 trans-aconitate 2-methyltransferase [Microlunatus parietis]
MPVWNPSVYLQFADQRSRPFFDLVGRVDADRPRTVVDLGCGPGQLTASLAERWPSATVIGLDSSPEMIEQAQAYASDRVSFAVADLRDWQPDGPVDVIISNATLQWIPEHRDLLPILIDRLSDGGWLAFQVPGNFDQPSHVLLYELARDPRFARWTEGTALRPVIGAAEYLDDLARFGQVDAWETTYLHLLEGPDPVFRWISGTGARPVLQALPEPQRTEFVAEYQALLREAYPAREHGTVLPFRRIFVVVRKP